MTLYKFTINSYGLNENALQAFNVAGAFICAAYLSVSPRM